MNKLPNERWTPEDTELFYKVGRVCGWLKAHVCTVQ
jgi:hypothetical protein